MQILILAVGIYVLLAFLRSTRGSGLVRGLGLIMIVGVYGLWGLSGQLGLDELKHVIQGLLGFVFVILAIVFQPELRRGIASLSENPLLGRILRTQRKEVISEVSLAVISMAKKKQGALIAFERKTPLDAYIEGAVKLECEVNRYLLDSVFHHGNVLHDGAVVIRGDLIVSAASLFPLTENIEISKSTGTRHRAALGLTEETDAVTVAVSEETGFISICKRGKIERRVPRAQLEEVLRERLGGDDGDSEPTSEEGESDGERKRRSWRFITEHSGQKLAALVLAVLVFYGAHQDLVISQEYGLRVIKEVLNRRQTPGALTIVFPDDRFRLGAGTERECAVIIDGTRDQLGTLGSGLGGVYVLPPGSEDGPLEIALEDVEWNAALGSLKAHWRDEGPQVEIEGLAEATLPLTAAQISVLSDQLDPLYEVDDDHLTFPSTLTVRGPGRVVSGEELELRLAEVTIPRDCIDDIDLTLALHPELVEQGLELIGTHQVGIPIRPLEVDVGTLEDMEIILVDLVEGNDSDALERFARPSDRARFHLYVRGVLTEEEANPESPVRKRLRTFVRENLHVFIDVGRLGEGSKSGLVEWHGLQDWREKLVEFDDQFTRLESHPNPDDLELRVVLESHAEVVLTENKTENGTPEEENP